jgi:DNA-binding NtrC family response regulator
MHANTVALSRTGTMTPAAAHTLVGQSAGFCAAMQRMQCHAASDAPLFVHGEPGTGKKLMARAVHYLGPRRHRPFIPVHCAGLAGPQAEHALRGLVDMAEGGTLFLDALHALPAGGQEALLRVLQACGDGQRGDHRPVASVRWIAASHTDLRAQAAAGRFHGALAERLDTVRIDLPPLRERLDDLPLLGAHLLGLAARTSGGHQRCLTPQGLAWLAGHDWPGNVQELDQLLRQAQLASPGDELGVAELLRGTPAPHLRGA